MCLQCGKMYKALRHTSKYCSTLCRVQYNRDMKGRLLIVTTNNKDKEDLAEWFYDSQRRVIRQFRDNYHFCIDFNYWQEETGLKVEKAKSRNPKIINDVRGLRNKLEALRNKKAPKQGRILIIKR